MFLRATTRKEDGKAHRYWSIVENRRLGDGRVLQRHVLYLGEINDSQAQAWRRSIEVLDERDGAPRTMALFPEDRCDALIDDASVVRLRLSQLRLCCRYIARPAISEQRLSISPQGRVRYQLKTPWRNGTTQVEWDAVDFIAKLAALVPPPRAHLTRFHGVFAPNAALRAQLTPWGRGKRPATDAEPVDVSANDEPRSPEGKRRAMSWAQRLKRVFGIDITTCAHCGGAVRIVASIEEPGAIPAIPAHFEKHGALEQAHNRPAARAPPDAAASVLAGHEACARLSRRTEGG
jgi:hypothetical protein